MGFGIKPLNGKQVSITIRGGETESERMVQVTIATGKDSPDVDSSDVKVSAIDEAGKTIQVTKFKTVTLIHPHVKAIEGERWASFKVVLKSGQKLSVVKVEWMGDQQTFAIANGVLKKE